MKNRLVRRTNGVQKSESDVQKTVLVVVANPFYYVEKFIFSTNNDTIKKGSLLGRWIHGVFPLLSVANKKNSLFLGVSDSFGFNPFLSCRKTPFQVDPFNCYCWLFITAPSLLIGC